MKTISDNVLQRQQKKNITLPINEITPHAVHTTKHIPILPEYFRAAVGLTKIPEPIITLIITFTAAIRPMLR